MGAFNHYYHKRLNVCMLLAFCWSLSFSFLFFSFILLNSIFCLCALCFDVIVFESTIVATMNFDSTSMHCHGEYEPPTNEKRQKKTTIISILQNYEWKWEWWKRARKKASIRIKCLRQGLQNRQTFRFQNMYIYYAFVLVLYPFPFHRQIYATLIQLDWDRLLCEYEWKFVLYCRSFQW